MMSLKGQLSAYPTAAFLTLLLAGSFAAKPAVAQQPFTEEGLSRGIVFYTLSATGAGRGVAFVDLDQDGDPDVVTMGGFGGVLGVFENDGTGYFLVRSVGSGLPDLASASGLVAADYDGDRDLDLYIACWAAEDHLLRNEGGFTFTDVTLQAGLGDPGLGTGPCWGDVDGDGWVDLYLANITNTLSTYRNRFYRNLGDGTFEEMSALLGIDDSNETWQSVFFDHDRDGDPDLYVSNDKGYDCVRHNYLFENVGGQFVDITGTSGTEACIGSMGVAVGDFDGNLLPDLYCANIPQGNPLFLNQGDGAFMESAGAWNVLSYRYTWAVHFFDYDNDGNLDLYSCNQGDPNRFYCHQGFPPALDLAGILGIDTVGSSYCMAVADIEGDGDLDLLVQNDNDVIRLYVNHEGEKRNWAQFRVVGADQNHFAVGASLELVASGHSQVREVAAGSNFKSQNDLVVHFGLGEAGMVTSVDTLWPGGLMRKVRNLPANRLWTLYPPGRLGDYEGNGVWDGRDLAAFYACYTGPGPGALQPGCEMMDLDGDGNVDRTDYLLLRERIDRAGNPAPPDPLDHP